LLDAYNYYLIIGGMPECVQSWITHKDPAEISSIQQELIELYENDFSKHNGKVNSGRILMVFRSLVTQISKDNEKFNIDNSSIIYFSLEYNPYNAYDDICRQLG
jgi:predicted AAA+ superfamily ATPase